MKTSLQLTCINLSFILIHGCNGNKEESKIRPSILFILSDDHTAQAWGIYEGILADFAHTPNIRQLAEEGCLLEHCLVSNSICTPSRATISQLKEELLRQRQMLGDTDKGNTELLNIIAANLDD